MLNRAYYSASINAFLAADPGTVLGEMALLSEFAIEPGQRDAWLAEIQILSEGLRPYSMRGKLYLEYSVPRLGKRIDAVAVIDNALFVLEFKVGETQFTTAASDQVFDYGLDLKNFHETSHRIVIAPILIATRAAPTAIRVAMTAQSDLLLLPIHSNLGSLGDVIEAVLALSEGQRIDPQMWENGRYCPTPTIIEAAMALYGGHSVSEISRSDASATNLTETSSAVSEIIRIARDRSQKSICFVTGVPGAGKTLVGLNIATQNIDRASDLYSVFLSGNGPLVAILREALARDKVRRERESGRKQEIVGTG